MTAEWQDFGPDFVPRRYFSSRQVGRLLVLQVRKEPHDTNFHWYVLDGTRDNSLLDWYYASGEEPTLERAKISAETRARQLLLDSIKDICRWE